VLSGQAAERIQSSNLSMVTITDSIQATDSVNSVSKIRQLTIAPLIADAMDRINKEKSVSSLFD